MFTQPAVYKIIKNTISVYVKYTKIKEGTVTAEELKKQQDDYEQIRGRNLMLRRIKLM